MRLAYWTIVAFTLVVACVSFASGALVFAYRPTLESAYTEFLDLRDVIALGVACDLHVGSAALLPLVLLINLLLGAIGAIGTSCGQIMKTRVVPGIVFSLIALVLAGGGWISGHRTSTLVRDEQDRISATMKSDWPRATPIIQDEHIASELTESAQYGDLLGGRFPDTAVAIDRAYVLHCVVVPIVFAATCVVAIWLLRPRKPNAVPQAVAPDAA